MLTIICGEDSIASRNYILDQQKIFREKDFEIVDIDYKAVLELDESQAYSASLFSQKRVFFTSSLNSKVLKKLNIKTEKRIKNLIDSKLIQIFDWEEEITSRDL